MSKYRVMLLACAATTLISGCASAKTTPVKPKKVEHKNGTVATSKLVNYPGQSPNVNIYKIFYWSQDKKVEMFAVVPKSPGTNFLIVSCHGGWDYPGGPYLSPITQGNVAANHNANAVTIYPEYSGYGDSQGSVKGLASNAIDVENAITAINSLKNVDIQSMSVDGTSMGGAVALMVASQSRYSNEVSNVILTSPFPGWEVAEAWDKNNKTSMVPGAEHQRNVKADGTAAYGEFTPSSKPYLKNSPVLKDIRVPVLLLQGTNDNRVPWQMTQMLYRDLKEDGVNATLDLVLGGNHGLTGKYNAKANNDITKWLQQIPAS